MEPVHECGGCGRFYPSDFPTCPFCYVQEFLEGEAEYDDCPICGSSETYIRSAYLRSVEKGNQIPSTKDIIAEIEGLLKG